MGMGEWFYVLNDAPAGPVGLDILQNLLQSRQINPNTLAWREGMPDWVPAGTVPELLKGIAPPPVAGAETISYFTPDLAAFRYAGFWLRFCAWFVDMIIIRIALVPGSFVIMQMGRMGNRPATLNAASALDVVVSLTAQWLYAALMESSSKQATLGKLAVGIKVTDTLGGRISFGQASGRHFAKYLSGIILLIGYIMAAFTERKQALHDMLASTLVVQK